MARRGSAYPFLRAMLHTMAPHCQCAIVRSQLHATACTQALAFHPRGGMAIASFTKNTGTLLHAVGYASASRRFLGCSWSARRLVQLEGEWTQSTVVLGYNHRKLRGSYECCTNLRLSCLPPSHAVCTIPRSSSWNSWNLPLLTWCGNLVVMEWFGAVTDQAIYSC